MVPDLPHDQSSSVRLRVIDLIRGCALFGIFVVNLPFMANTIYEADRGTGTSVDAAVRFMVSALFQLKFYLLFSFVFGLSFGMQLNRARPAPMAYSYRRLAGLAILGLIDGAFLFVGDILLSYGLLAFILLWIRQWPAQRLWRLGVFLGASAVLVYALALVGMNAIDPGVSETTKQAAREAYLGSFWEGAVQRARDLTYVIPFLMGANWLSIVAMFAWGLAAAKTGLFEDSASFLVRNRHMAATGLALGLPTNLIFGAAAMDLLPATDWPGFLALVLSPVASILLSFSYLYGLVWLHRRYGARLSVLEAAGRLSLSNYLGQAVFAGFVFNGWGLGQLGRWDAAGLLLLAAGWFVVQATASAWYLRRFVMGPDEWLLRSFSKWQWQPFRRRGPSRLPSIGGITIPRDDAK